MSNLTGTMTVRGRDFEVNFDPEGGHKPYSTRFDGRYLASASWVGLQTAIGAELRKTDVDVEVRFLDPVSRRLGTAYKIHRGTGKVLVKWDGSSRSEQVDLGRVLTPDTDVAELQRLQVESNRAAKALDDFVRAHGLGETYESLPTVVTKAITKAAEEAEAAARMEGVQPVELDDAAV